MNMLINRCIYNNNNVFIITRNFTKAPKMKPFRKHPQVRDNRPLVQKRRQINEQHEISAQESGLPWRIVASRLKLLTILILQTFYSIQFILFDF